MRNHRWLQGSLSLLFVALSASQAQEIAKPEGLLLRGFESEALKNRRGFEAVENGVLTTVRVDAAGELSATRTAAEIEPHICLLYTSPSPRDLSTSRMPSSA